MEIEVSKASFRTDTSPLRADVLNALSRDDGGREDCLVRGPVVLEMPEDSDRLRTQHGEEVVSVFRHASKEVGWLALPPWNSVQVNVSPL